MAFGNFIRGLFSQVNPFDNGRTYSTVQKEEEEKRRRQAAAKPQPQQPATQPQQRLSVAQPRKINFAPPKGQTFSPQLRITNTVKAIKDRSPNEVTQNLRNFDAFGTDDQVRLLQRATRLGILDKKNAALDIQSLLTGRDARKPLERTPNRPNQSFFDKLKDIVQVDSKADQYRRLKMQEPRFYRDQQGFAGDASEGLIEQGGDFGQAVIDRIGGGIIRGSAKGLAFLLEGLPGEQQKAVEEFLNKYSENTKGGKTATNPFAYDETSAGGRVGRTVGTGVKAGVDVYGIGKVGQLTRGKIPAGANLLARAGRFGAGSLAETGVASLVQKGQGNDINLAREAGIGVVADLAFAGTGKLWSVARGSKSNVLKQLTSDDTPSAVARTIEQTFKNTPIKLSDDALTAIANTNDKQLIETILGLEVDKSIRLTGGEYQFSQEAADRLKGEGITSLKGADTPYGAEYAEGDIRLRDANMGRDEVLYHELGHDIWSRRVSEADRAALRALPPGTAQKNAMAQGRRGYDLVEEDFADYISLALRGQSELIPESIRAMINRYAKVMVNNAKKAGISTDSLLQGASARGFTQSLPEGASPTVSPSRLDIPPQTTPTPSKALPEVGQGSGVPNITPQLKAELEPIAKQLGVTTDELVEMTKTKPVSDISEAAPDTISKQLEEKILGSSEADYVTSTGGKLAETLSPDRQLRKATAPAEGFINKLFRNSLESGSRVGRLPGRLLQGLSRQSGRTSEELAQIGRLQGGKKAGDILGQAVKESGDDVVSQGIRRDVVAGALDPDLARARGQKPVELTVAEQAEANKLKEIIELTHEGNYKLGMIDEKTYNANKGKYFPRDFTEFFNDDAARRIAKDNKLELNIFKTRKDLADIPKEVLDSAEQDPYFLTALRVQQFERNKAVTQYSNWLAENGSIVDAPRTGYIQVPDSPSYGALRGKHVLKEQLEDLQGFIYETNTAQQFVGLLNAYDRFKPRQVVKAIKTIYNPGVRFGNRTFNYLITSLNGINPVTFTRNYARGSKLMKNNAPEYLDATRQGIFGSTIIEKELYRGSELTRKSSGVSKALNKVGDTYSGVDDKSKFATYLTFRERGLSGPEAAARTRRMMQNYDMVGSFFDLGAKSPVFGNAFVRFSSELMRIMQNTVVDNPIRAAGAAAALSTLVTMGSKLSGENAENRKTREDRLGAPRIPFTNQSLEIQTPWGAVNAGRLIGLTTYNDLTGGATEDLKRLAPFQSPVRKSKDGGVELNIQGLASDPLIGPAISLLANEDFRGKNIADPDAIKYPSQPLSSGEQNKKRLNFLKMAYAPLSNEIDSVVSAARGKENYYGKERSLPQAVLRSFGLKVEQFGPGQAEETRSRNAFFENKDKISKLAAGLGQEEQNVIAKYLNREKKRSEDVPGGTHEPLVPYNWRDKSIKAAEMEKYPEVFKVLKQKAIDDAKRNNLPVDPLYKLDSQQLRQFWQIEKANNDDPGSPASKKMKRDASSWYWDFTDKRRAYFNEVKPFYEKLKAKGVEFYERPDSVQYPDVRPETQKKLDSLESITDGAERAKFYKENPDVTDFYTRHENYIRELRAERNLPQFDRYPKTPPELQKFMDEYSSLPKSKTAGNTDPATNKARSSWIKSHPKEWAAMTEQWSKVAQYNLQNDAARAIYEDEELSEKGIKSIQSLAKALGMEGGSGFGFGFGDKQGSTRGSTDITNLAGGDVTNAFKDLPKIRRQNRTTVKIPSAYKPRKINIQSLSLPNALPTFDSTQGRK